MCQRRLVMDEEREDQNVRPKCKVTDYYGNIFMTDIRKSYQTANHSQCGNRMLLHPYTKERLPNPSGNPLGPPFHKQPCEEELNLVIAPAPPIGTPYSIVLYSTLNDGLDLIEANVREINAKRRIHDLGRFNKLYVKVSELKCDPENVPPEAFRYPKILENWTRGVKYGITILLTPDMAVDYKRLHKEFMNIGIDGYRFQATKICGVKIKDEYVNGTRYLSLSTSCAWFEVENHLYGNADRDVNRVFNFDYELSLSISSETTKYQIFKNSIYSAINHYRIWARHRMYDFPFPKKLHKPDKPPAWLLPIALTSLFEGGMHGEPYVLNEFNASNQLDEQYKWIHEVYLQTRRNLSKRKQVLWDHRARTVFSYDEDLLMSALMEVCTMLGLRFGDCNEGVSLFKGGMSVGLITGIAGSGKTTILVVGIITLLWIAIKSPGDIPTFLILSSHNANIDSLLLKFLDYLRVMDNYLRSHHLDAEFSRLQNVLLPEKRKIVRVYSDLAEQNSELLEYQFGAGADFTDTKFVFTTYGKWYRNINFEFKGLAPNILIGDEIGNIHLLEMISSTVITSDIDFDGIRPYSTISLAIFGGEDGQIEPLIWLDQIRSPYTAINNESISHWNHVFTPFIVHALCDLPLVSIVRLKRMYRAPRECISRSLAISYGLLPMTNDGTIAQNDVLWDFVVRNGTFSPQLPSYQMLFPDLQLGQNADLLVVNCKCPEAQKNQKETNDTELLAFETMISKLINGGLLFQGGHDYLTTWAPLTFYYDQFFAG
uniref:Uncharacterized protein n=1 Tax=Acrobeloides nanus TaxID=290746 RepID=A0A914ENV7_9BILA